MKVADTEAINAGECREGAQGGWPRTIQEGRCRGVQQRGVAGGCSRGFYRRVIAEEKMKERRRGEDRSRMIKSESHSQRFGNYQTSRFLDYLKGYSNYLIIQAHRS